jgi:hypothetical protein
MGKFVVRGYLKWAGWLATLAMAAAALFMGTSQL